MAEAPAATELQPEADPPESEKKEDVLGGTADGTPSVTSDGPGREPSQIFSQAGQGQIATTILPNLAREHSNRAHQVIHVIYVITLSNVVEPFSLPVARDISSESAQMGC